MQHAGASAELLGTQQPPTLSAGRKNETAKPGLSSNDLDDNIGAFKSNSYSEVVVASTSEQAVSKMPSNVSSSNTTVIANQTTVGLKGNPLQKSNTFAASQVQNALP